MTNHQGNANQNHNELLEGLLSKSQETPNTGEDMEKREPLCTGVGNVNWYSHYGKEYRGSPRN